MEQAQQKNSEKKNLKKLADWISPKGAIDANQAEYIITSSRPSKITPP
jgi:nitrous oxide reductase accessory protein NosL